MVRAMQDPDNKDFEKKHLASKTLVATYVAHYYYVTITFTTVYCAYGMYIRIAGIGLEYNNGKS